MQNEGLLGKVRNIPSGDRYLVSTAKEKGGYWSTCVFRIGLFGVPVFTKKLLSVIRNSREEAVKAHGEIVWLVETNEPTDWQAEAQNLVLLPDQMNKVEMNIINRQRLKLVREYGRIVSSGKYQTIYPESKMPAPKTIIQDALQYAIFLGVTEERTDEDHYLSALSAIYVGTSGIIPDEQAEILRSFNKFTETAGDSLSDAVIKQMSDLPLQEIAKIQQSIADEAKNLLYDINQYKEQLRRG